MKSDIEGVQSTSFDALRTKISCVINHYYDDPFILDMEPGVSHKKFLPLINRGTYCRVYVINNTLNQIITNHKKLMESKKITDSKINIIILGSGFDTTFFNLILKGNTNIEVYEYDYKKIIDKKIEKIKKSNTLNQIYEENKSKYHLLPIDITKNKDFKTSLENINNNDNDLTIVICECLLVYINRDTTIQMLSNICNVFKNVYLLEYDLIEPNDPFGKEMVQNLKKRNIKLKGFEEVQNLQDQIDRLKESKFDYVYAIDMLEVYFKLLPLEERKRIEKLELMDEFEEFNLLQKHACFCYAYNCKNEDFKSFVSY